MKLYSTRNLNEIKNPKDAIIKGLSNDGGLYCPKYEDIVSHRFDIGSLLSNDYKATAKLVFGTFFDDFTDEEIVNCINLAYNKNNFDEDYFVSQVLIAFDMLIPDSALIWDKKPVASY